MSETTRKDIEHGSYRYAENLIAELDRRLAEDDANPNDTVSWESIRTEAQARWKNYWEA
jgi:putative addiction module component (TIGR02574 family)